MEKLPIEFRVQMDLDDGHTLSEVLEYHKIDIHTCVKCGKVSYTKFDECYIHKC